MNVFGVRYRTTIFGTSHGPFVGCTIEGLHAGMRIDEAFDLYKGVRDRTQAKVKFVWSPVNMAVFREFFKTIRDAAMFGKIQV